VLLTTFKFINYFSFPLPNTFETLLFGIAKRTANHQAKELTKKKPPSQRRTVKESVFLPLLWRQDFEEAIWFVYFEGRIGA
jgi:hypothetical protein